MSKSKKCIYTVDLTPICPSDESRHGVAVVEITLKSGKKKHYVYSSLYLGLYYKVFARSLASGKFHLSKMQKDYDECTSMEAFIWDVSVEPQDYERYISDVLDNYKGLYNKRVKLPTHAERVALWPRVG